MNTTPDKVHRDWRIPDALWERIVPLLPPRAAPLRVPSAPRG